VRGQRREGRKGGREGGREGRERGREGGDSGARHAGPQRLWPCTAVVALYSQAVAQPGRCFPMEGREGEWARRDGCAGGTLCALLLAASCSARL